MDNRSSTQSSNTAPAQNTGKGINSLPTEVWLEICKYVENEPDETTRDKTAQKRSNLRPLFLVSKRVRNVAMEQFYKVTAISSPKSLQRVHETFRVRPEKAQFVRELSVDFEVCWDNIPKSLKRDLCRYLYQVLSNTSRLQLLSLDLRECTCCFRNCGPESFAADGANVGYDEFYNLVADRIQNELNVKAESRTFLRSVEKFFFASSDILYKHSAFFALPSLEHIVSMRDKGAWFMILGPGNDIGILNPHIKELSLKNTAILPHDVALIGDSFPNLEKFRARTDPEEANHQYDPNAPTDINLTAKNLSATLAKWRKLQLLELELDYLRIMYRRGGISQINFPMHLGLEGGIRSLGGMPNLTDLKIGMHLLMGYRVKNSKRRAQPMPPSVLPPALERLQLYTCVNTWDEGIACFPRNNGPQRLPSFVGDSTMTFVKALATYVSNYAVLPHLSDVRVYSQRGWWLVYGVDLRIVRHCKEEGQIWDAGGFEHRCGISRFEKRTPGIHFRAFETGAIGYNRASTPNDS